MNELDQTLQNMIQKALEVATKTGDFIIDQAPIMLKEFYTWHIFMHIFAMIIAILITILSFQIIKLFGNKTKQKSGDVKFFKYYYKNGEEIPAFLIVFICNIVTFILFLTHLYNLIFILVAPRLYIIDYFIGS